MARLTRWPKASVRLERSGESSDWPSTVARAVPAPPPLRPARELPPIRATSRSWGKGGLLRSFRFSAMRSAGPLTLTVTRIRLSWLREEKPPWACCWVRARELAAASERPEGAITLRLSAMRVRRAMSR